MGLFSTFRTLSSRKRRSRSPAVEAANVSHLRICRVEQLEPRQYLSASTAPTPISVGAVYHDLNSPDPTIGSLFYVSWTGGAPGTVLTQFTIQTDTNGGGSIVFHTQPDSTLPNGYVAPAVNTQLGNNITLASPISAPDDGTVMTANLTNFQAGQVLVINATVDHSQNDGTDPEVDGFDFANSTFTATFSNSQCATLPPVTGTFSQDASGAVSSSFQAAGLNLPSEDYTTPPQSAYTDVAFTTAEQAYLPTIAGTVFFDANAGSPSDTTPSGTGVANVTVDLLNSGGTQIAQTTTDGSGNYSFTCPGPGTYSVVEDSTTIPSGDITWDAFPGTLNGVTDAAKSSITELTTITVQNNDNSIQNNFSLAQPVTISGYVYYDQTDSGQWQSTDPGVTTGVLTLYQEQANGSYASTGKTATLDPTTGAYSFTGLARARISWWKRSPADTTPARLLRVISTAPPARPPERWEPIPLPVSRCGAGNRRRTATSASSKAASAAPCLPTCTAMKRCTRARAWPTSRSRSTKSRPAETG